MTAKTRLPKNVPPLTQYYFYLTAGCNLACRHCWLSPAYQPGGTTGGHLDFDLFRLALDEGIPLGLRSVKLTGGEPMLHPDFLRMVDLLKEYGISFSMETNGTLLTPEMARYLKEKSTLTFVSVSIDGATPESHDAFRGVPGAYRKSEAAVKALADQGYRPQVIMSIHGGNAEEVEAVTTQAVSWGAGSVKYNLVMPVGRGEVMTERSQVLDIQRLVDLGRWVERDLQKRVPVNLLYSWPMAFHSLTRLMNQGDFTCAIFNILGVLANGSLAMCGIGMEVPELTYGRLGVDPVREVWVHNPILRKLRRVLPGKLEGVCGECLLKNQCLGSCVAENYHQSGRLTASFWFCQQAQEAGLMPSQRLKSG